MILTLVTMSLLSFPTRDATKAVCRGIGLSSEVTKPGGNCKTLDGAA